MSEEKKVKMTGLFWLEKGTLGKGVRQGDEIPVGHISDALMEKFKKEGKIGEKIVSSLDLPEIVRNLRKENSDLKKELEKAKKSGGGSDSDKVKAVKEQLEESENANEELSAEVESANNELEAIKNAIEKLSDEYPELETKLQEIIEADTEDQGVLGKIGSWLKRDK